MLCIFTSEFVQKMNFELDAITHQSLLNWPPYKIEFQDRIFYFARRIQDKQAFFWIYFYGSPEEALHYVYKMSLEFDEIVLSFKGRVISLDKSKEEITENEPTFNIGYNTLMKLQKESNAREMPITIKIENSKEEVKNENEESGLSDESDF